MVAMGILQLVVFAFITVSGVLTCSSSTLTSWGSWGSCSRSCGGGSRNRFRCVNGFSESQSQSCNQWCYNGASYRYGSCQCSLWRSGTCCQSCRYITIPQCMPGRQSCGGSPDGIKCTQCYDPFYSAGYNEGCQACPDIAYCKNRYCTTASNTKCRECIDDLKRYKRTNSNTMCQRMCAWDNQHCWPGNCANGLTIGCSCSKDFITIQTSTETSCQPKTPAEFVKCDTDVIGTNGNHKNANTGSGTVACQPFKEFYGNFIPVLLQYDLESRYNIDVSGYTQPSYIHEYKFGITDVVIYIKQKYLNGSVETLSKHEQYVDPTLTSFVNFTRTDKGMINVSTSFHSLHDGESLCFEYESYAGGYLKSKNLLTQQVNAAVNYRKVKSSQTICYNFDDTPPKHCKEDGNCDSEPLKVDSPVTRSPFNMVTYAEWFDPVSKGGKAAQASGIQTFTINVNRVLSTKGHLIVDYSTMYMKIMNNASTAASVYLRPDRPTLYVIKLDVKDNAGNVKQARRFLLYDNTSFIETIKHRPLIVTSASIFNNLSWQTNNLDICLSWRNRYLNRFYVDGKLLSASYTDQDVNFTGVYEQTQGLLSVYGTPNVFGIIKVLVSVYINDKMYFEGIEIPDFENQTYCCNFNTTDGEQYVFEVKPVDIAGNTYTENVTVYIDQSGPLLDIVSLTVKDEENKSIIQLHSSEDVVQFEARDPHSGINTITWRIGIFNSNLKIATGSIDVQHLHICPNDTRKCYCPAVGSCEVYHYSCPLGQLVCDDRVGESVRRDPYLSIEVINNAQLSSKEVIRLSVDSTYYSDQCKSSSQRLQGGIAVGVSAGIIVALLCAAVFVYRRRECTKGSILLRQHNGKYGDLEHEATNTDCMTLAEESSKPQTSVENSAPIFSASESYEDLDAKKRPTEQQYETVSAEKWSKQKLSFLRIMRTKLLSKSSKDDRRPRREQSNIYEVIFPPSKTTDRIELKPPAAPAAQTASVVNSPTLTTTSLEKAIFVTPALLPSLSEVVEDDNETTFDLHIPERVKLPNVEQDVCNEERESVENSAPIFSASESYEDLDAKKRPTEQQYETVSAEKWSKQKLSFLRIMRTKLLSKSSKDDRRPRREQSNIYEDIFPPSKTTDRIELKPPAAPATQTASVENSPTLTTTSLEKALFVTPALLPSLSEVVEDDNETTFDLHIPERVKLPNVEQDVCNEEREYDNTVLKPSLK